MNTVENLLSTLHKAHCDNARQAYYAKRYGGRSHSTMPATSFVFEFFLFNSLYQHDWQTSIEHRDLKSWSVEKLKELQQQVRFEKFIRSQCQSRPDIIKRAFSPVAQLEDLDGEWTTIIPDSRINREHGRSFFKKLSRMRDLLCANDPPNPTGSFFKLIGDCRYFVYLVRNNIFHGSKSIGEIYEREQRRRIEVYDIFLKSLVSLFFLAVDKTPVAADFVQLPIRIRSWNGDVINIGQSDIADLVASGFMKPEDSRLIPEFISQRSLPLRQSGPRDSLFYPSSGRDYLTPLLLGLPYCSQFFFCDVGRCHGTRSLDEHLCRHLRVRPERSNSGDGESVVFHYDGIQRIIRFVSGDNMRFLNSDVDLSFYFHRGDSSGEGGAGQKWDSQLFPDLCSKVADAGICQILTDGEPGGLHKGVANAMQKITIPNSHRRRDYYIGQVTRDFLRKRGV